MRDVVDGIKGSVSTINSAMGGEGYVGALSTARRKRWTTSLRMKRESREEKLSPDLDRTRLADAGPAR